MRLMFEGKLAHEWVSVAELVWGTVETGGEKSVVLDLRGLTFVDHAGEQFLEKAYAAGAFLLGSDPMMRTLIEEIKARTPRKRASKELLSFFTILFLSLLIAVLAISYPMGSDIDKTQPSQQTALQPAKAQP
jgi:hypothetical protein